VHFIALLDQVEYAIAGVQAARKGQYNFFFHCRFRFRVCSLVVTDALGAVLSLNPAVPHWPRS
jgi:hypothetical protein